MTDDDRLGRLLGSPVRSTRELDGGMVGTVRRVDLADGRTVVAKTGDTPLSVEGRMLASLADNGLPVPAVRHATDDLLVLSYVEGGSDVTPAVERDAARHLAALHGVTADRFGFPFDTLTGPVPQPNPWTDSWPAFFVDRRLAPLRDRCLAAGAIDDDLAARVTDVADRCDRLLDHGPVPGLVHGDVWTENLRTDGSRVRAFLDPACYYADPEVELAYVDWTGTFGDPFFDRYAAERGVDPAFFEIRRFVYRLPPLLVHALLFGAPYDRELGTTLDRLDV